MRSNTATIANGQSLSGSVYLGDQSLVGIQMPAAFTGTALTFQAAQGDGSSFSNVHNATGTEIQVTVAANRYVIIDPALLAGALYLKIRSGTSAAPTAEAAARDIKIFTAGVFL